MSLMEEDSHWQSLGIKVSCKTSPVILIGFGSRLTTLQRHPSQEGPNTAAALLASRLDWPQWTALQQQGENHMVRKYLCEECV